MSGERRVCLGRRAAGGTQQGLYWSLIDRGRPLAGDQVLLDNEEQQGAQSNSRNLKTIAEQIAKPGGPDARQALDAYINSVSVTVDNTTQQAEIQQAPE